MHKIIILNNFQICENENSDNDPSTTGFSSIISPILCAETAKSEHLYVGDVMKPQKGKKISKTETYRRVLAKIIAEFNLQYNPKVCFCFQV